MKRTLSIMLCFIAFTAFSQNRVSHSDKAKNLYNDFIVDYTKALNKNFTEAALNKMFQKYGALLTPHSDITRLKESLEGYRSSIYPLFEFRKQKLYTNNISKLVNSQNPDQRILAYLVIAASGDTSEEDILLQKIKNEHAKGNLIWAGMALLYLNCNHTTPIFDFLVKNEDFGDAHMVPLYIQLNKDSLQNTAYNRINSEDIKAKILAAQILSVTPLNTKTEELLKQAIKSWNINIKGYAIYSIRELQIGNLLESFKPLLDSSQTRSIALGALANSPTAADRNYLFDLVNKQRDTIPDEMLDCFYKSKNIDNVKYWLTLVYTRLISQNYYFSVYDQELILSNNILPDLQKTLQNSKNPKILAELVRTLEFRSDDTSISIMINFLSNADSTVRYWTAKTLKNNSSPKIKTEQVQDLINKILKDG